MCGGRLSPNDAAQSLATAHLRPQVSMFRELPTAHGGTGLGRRKGQRPDEQKANVALKR